MKLEEAIKHARQKAKELRILSQANHEGIESCIKCAEEHEQLADWLEELLIWRKNGVKNKDCFTCKNESDTGCTIHQGKCEYEPLEELKKVRQYCTITRQICSRCQPVCGNRREMQYE